MSGSSPPSSSERGSPATGPSFPTTPKASIKSDLIDSITLKHSPLARRASANAVSIIAKYAVPAGELPELLPFLFQCSQSPQEDHREKIVGSFDIYEVVSIFFDDPMSKRNGDGDSPRAGPFFQLLVGETPQTLARDIMLKGCYKEAEGISW